MNVIDTVKHLFISTQDVSVWMVCDNKDWDKHQLIAINRSRQIHATLIDKIIFFPHCFINEEK